MQVRWNELEKRWVGFIKTEKKTYIYHYHAVHERFVSCWCFTLSRSSLGWRYFFLIDLLAQEITSTGMRTHHHHSFLQICVFFPERLGLATSMNSQGHQRQQFRFNSTDKFESTIVEQGGLDVHNHVSGSPWCIGLILVCASDLPYKPNV